MNDREISELFERLIEDFYVYRVGVEVLSNDSAISGFLSADEIRSSRSFVLGKITRKDGTHWWFNRAEALQSLRASPVDLEGLQWFTGAILQAGNELDHNDYFDKSPALEFFRHLRNGVAHGNRFDIRRWTKKTPRPLALFTTPGAEYSPDYDGTIPTIEQRTFIITPQLNGTPVLFAFMKAGDLLDLFWYLNLYLGDGVESDQWPIQPDWTQFVPRSSPWH